MEDQEWKDDHYYHQFFQCESDSQQFSQGDRQNQQNLNQCKKQAQQYPKDQKKNCQEQEELSQNIKNRFYSLPSKLQKTQIRQAQNQKKNRCRLKYKINLTLKSQAQNKKNESYSKITNQIGLKAILCLHQAFPQKKVKSLIQAIKDKLQKAKEKQNSQLITMTMDQLQTYHLKSGVKKFIPPRSNYSYAALKIKQQQKDNKSYVKFEKVKKQNCGQNQQVDLQKKLTQQQQFTKIKGIFCLTKLVRQSKSYADLKNIIFKRFNNKDAFQMCKDKKQYLKKLATMKQATIYFLKIGYDVKKMRTLMDNYTLSRIKYQKLFLCIIRLLVRLVQTFIVKYYFPDIRAIPHNPNLLLLQAPFHNPNEHFQYKMVEIYYKILRLMFQIQETQENRLNFEEVLYFYKQVQNTIQKTLRQRQKYRETTNQKLISSLRRKQIEKD